MMINSSYKISGGGRIPLAPGFRRIATAIRGHTPSWVRPGTGSGKIHPSSGRTRRVPLKRLPLFPDYPLL
jgi:hypothetical protein